MLLDYFPRNIHPRDSQIQILKELDDVFSSGYRRIIISAPTGIGKSFVAKTIANAMDSSFIVTSTKHLQDQYLQDFPKMKSIKGMANFACYQLMDLEKVTGVKKAMRMNLSCDKGQCTKRKDGKQVSACKYKSGHEADKQCLYYTQKTEGLKFSQTVLNYAIYFQLKKYQPTLPGVQRNIGVFDEAHTIENEIVRFLSLDVRQAYLSDVGIAPSRYSLDDTEEAIRLLDDLKLGYGTLLSKIEADSTQSESARQTQYYSKMLDRFNKLVDFRTMITTDKENFVIQTTTDDNENRTLSIIPIDIGKFANRFFDSEYQVFLSGTIDRDNFSKSLGLEDCAFINIPKSPFPKENREIKFLNIRRLTNSSSFEDRMEVIKQIGKVMERHQDERGLILTSSKSRCDYIRRYLPREQRRRVQLAHSRNEDGSTIEDVLEAHEDTKNGVLLSSSLWQGIDLKDDLSRFQIIEKCPYLFLGDRRVMMKKTRDPDWYLYQTMMKLLQGFGRSVRNNQDHATTYVMDTSVQHLLASNRHTVPLAYHDVIYN